ncbi:vacuolar protein sorting-associated protein 33B-like [Liolophura sinensis]|uniref:vacuolar protein sorting-associated protein 33B-like n=1 Tax=Liolophura sinensis TaxID=3198878 RepID=UPI00315818AA
MRPLDRVAGASLLKEHGVEKIFKLDPSQRALSGCEQRLYLVRPQMTTMKYIANHVLCEREKHERRSYKILFVPKKMHVCEMILETEGVLGYVSLDCFPLDLIPLDVDLLSMELPEFLRTFYMDGDQGSLHSVAQSLVNLQSLYGVIPNVYAIGKGSRMVNELVKTMLSSMTEPSLPRNEIDSMVLIDRDVDFVTPLCSQLTYEGLLDETFGIHSGFIEFDRAVTGKDQPVKLLLTSHDELYNEVRDRHFSNVFGFLSSKAKEVQTGYDKRHDLKSVGDMKTYVANELKGLKQKHKHLVYHIGACEIIMNKKTKGDFEDYLRTEHCLLEGSDIRENINYIEECINRQMNALSILRLLCLLSQTQGGLLPKDYKSLRAQFLHSHGFEHLLNFFNLKKLGLLCEQEVGPSGGMPLGKMASSMGKRSVFQAVSKKLNLIPRMEDINLKSPVDMSYVFSGAFTPLSCKLVEQVLTREGFAGLEETTRSLPGGTFASVRNPSGKGKGSPMPATKSSASRVVLVYFLGGCTFSEIAALRFLGRQKGYRFLVATTSLINGKTMLESLLEL